MVLTSTMDGSTNMYHSDWYHSGEDHGAHEANTNIIRTVPHRPNSKKLHKDQSQCRYDETDNIYKT